MLNPAQVLSSKVSRRKFLAGITAGAGTAAALSIAGCSDGTLNPVGPTKPAPAAITDTDILNFALNLEYLEAEFYLRAAFGTGLSSADTGGGGTVNGGSQVSFTDPGIQAYAIEIAQDELNHVRFLRSALGSAAVAEPDIDLVGSFNAAASAAGISGGFNPFADQYQFLLGAFTFEDVGVTAYHGAAPLLTMTANLVAAGGILGTEAYHAGLIRELIIQNGSQAVGSATGPTLLSLAVDIQNLRAAAGGGNETILTSQTIANADQTNFLSYSRSTSQVLDIVYLNATGTPYYRGGFFPNGVNGTINSSAS